MKNLAVRKLIVLALILMLFGVSLVKGQGFQAKTYIEKTHVSPKFGTAIGYVFGDQIEVGGFFQRASVQEQAEYGRPLQSENEFYGAYFAYPLLSGKTAHLKLNVRTGVSNGENFAITPSLQASYQPLKFLSVGGGIGARAFRPTYMATISIKLNNNKGGRYLASK